MNTPVSFEIAKLLKEKGFDEPCRYVHDTWNNIKDWLEGGEGEHRNSHQNGSVYYSAPTISDVVMWLSNKQIDLCHIVNYTKGVRTYRMGIIYVKNNLIESVFIRPENEEFYFIEFDSLNAAYTAGIEYTLKNLI